MKLVFLDTETTSLKEGRLVQLAYLPFDSNEKLPAIPYEKKFKPPVPIEFEAMATHHITEKMVADLPPFTALELGNVLETHVMVAHNAPFDIGILENEGIPRPKVWIDTKKVAQAYFDFDCYKLQYLRYRFGIEIEASAHDALGDIIVLREVFNTILLEASLQEVAQGRQYDEREVIRKFVEISRNPLELRRMPYGKYQGTPFEELVKKDLQYVRWLKKNITETGRKDQEEDLYHTLSLYV